MLRLYFINISFDFYQIYFYDYGTLKTYKTNEVYFLDDIFSRTQAQAIPCALHNTKPISEDKWSKDVSQRFADKVLSKKFVAEVIKIENKVNFFFKRIVIITLYHLSLHYNA